MALKLGPVRSHVRSAAEEISKFSGITNIGGWRAAGSVPGSDHPKGLAIDVMVNSKAKGDSVAAYVIANAARLAVTYIIWYERIWQDGKWGPYTHPSGNSDTLAHRDHVHVSFSAQGSSVGGEPVIPGSGIADAISDFVSQREEDTISGTLAVLAGGSILAFLAAFLVLGLIFYVWWKNR